MPDQVIDAAAARSLHADASRDRPMVGWVVMRDLPEYPDKVIARLVTAVPTPYLLLADDKAGIRERLPPGLVRMGREPADPMELQPDARTETIVLDLPGRSAEYVVLSAHIDGHALGESALDNATGVAVALALARAAAPHAGASPRGLRVCLFSAEEWALSGSLAWLSGLAGAEVRRMALNLNLDTVTGGTHLTALTSGFAALGPFVTGAARGAGLELGVHVPPMPNSDHASFAACGIPALRLVSGFDEPGSKIRLLLTRHDRRDLVGPGDFVAPVRAAWGILRAALAAPAGQLAALRSTS